MINLFTKQQRVTRRCEYQTISKTASKIKAHYWLFLYQKNTFNKPRLGITVSKKCSKLAVDRNRIKRIVRESFRLNNQSLPGLDIVVIARWSAKEADNNELFNSLGKQWGKFKRTP